MTERRRIEDGLLKEAYECIRHKSGLTVYVFPKNLTNAYASLTVRFGSLANRFRLPGESEDTVIPDGVAHFLEHKMFESEDGIDTFDKFAAVGASANAYTSNELTSYLFSTAEDLERPLRILLHYVFHPHFTAENVKKEQGIIAQEIKMYEDSPQSRLYYAMMKQLYHVHGIRTNICGSEESIAAITPELLMRTYRAFYHPANMILVVCGRIEPEQVLALVDEALPEATEAPAVTVGYPAEPKPIRKKSMRFSMDVNRPTLWVGFKDTALPADSEERVKRAMILNMANDILFGESSHFYRELYDRGILSRNFSVCYESLTDCGHTIFGGQTDEPETLLSALREEMARLQREPIAREDFERCRRVHYAEYVRDFDSTEEIASAILDSVIDGVELFRTGEMLRGITYEEVLREASLFFTEENLSTVVLEPIKPA